MPFPSGNSAGGAAPPAPAPASLDLVAYLADSTKALKLDSAKTFQNSSGDFIAYWRTTAQHRRVAFRLPAGRALVEVVSITGGRDLTGDFDQDGADPRLYVRNANLRANAGSVLRVRTS